MMMSRRAELAAGACSWVLLAGVLGLAWWGWRHRPGHAPRPVPLRRTRRVLVGLGLFIIAVGTVWQLVTVLRPVPECVSPGPLPTNSLNAWVIAQKVATWPATGLGVLYSQVTGAHLCLSRVENYYVAVNEQHIAGARAVALGNIVLKPDIYIPPQNMLDLVEHEAGHRAQWAVGTVLAGPVAFPVAYGVVNFFFPDERNPFERMAGLETGGYTSYVSGPVFGPAQIAVLSALAAGVLALFVIRFRRRSGPR